MVMVSFRPHLLRILTRGNGQYNHNGDWVETNSSPNGGYIRCRYEPNGAARTITLQDGKEYVYSYTVYLCVNPALEIKYGDIIELTSQDGKVIGTFEVKGFHRGQLDMKVWV